MEKLLDNRILICALAAWAAAQLAKTVIYAILNRELNWNRLFGDGGMPSGHSATVTSIAVTAAIHYGTGSFEFALAAILAIIVCHDAMGVRLETGKQAIVLNELVKAFNVLSDQDLSEEVKLKEFVGHTPVQVITGILLGIANACLMYFVVLQ